MNKLKNGFTLIELMIVIAIIGIIAAVLLPVLTGKSSGGQNSYTYDSNGYIQQPGYTQQQGNVTCR